jgi:hypothetical protein
MTIAVVYCYPCLNAMIYDAAARKFSQTYQRFPPGKTPHTVVVVGNGPAMGPRQQKILEGLPHVTAQHNNFGRDLGAFERAAATVPCDLMVFCGAHVNFWRAGWLDRIVDSYVQNGPGMYGPWGFYEPSAHLRTTCFWMPPQLMQSYPYAITDGNRYQAEHGANSFTLWCQRLGFPTIMVTWTKVLDQRHWEHVTRDDTLVLDQHLERLGWK